MADPATPPALRRGFALADAITLVRIPLAIAFPIFGGTTERLLLLGLAAATDLGDGVVARRYRELGGAITLIAKPGVGHHPHGLADPTPVVEFIIKNLKAANGQ